MKYILEIKHKKLVEIRKNILFRKFNFKDFFKKEDEGFFIFIEKLLNYEERNFTQIFSLYFK